jgi:hypothetical protein
MENQTMLAWAAGFIDGEGCVTIRKYKSPRDANASHMLDIHVVNTNLDALNHLQSIFGVGNVYRLARSDPRYKTRSVWQYVCTSAQAEGVLRSVLPYLIVKKRDAEVALQFASLPKTSYGRGGIPEDVYRERERLFCLIREGRENAGQKRRGAPSKAKKSERIVSPKLPIDNERRFA